METLNEFRFKLYEKDGKTFVFDSEINEERELV